MDGSTPATEETLFKGDLGLVGKTDQDRLRDLFLRREIFQLIKKKWWPVKLLTKTLKMGTTKDKIFSIPIEWKVATGGSYFYTPMDVDLGDGILTDNIFDAVIRDLQTVVAFDGDQATATHTFTIYSAAGVQTDHAEIRIGANDPWQQVPWPLVDALQTIHGLDLMLEIYVRAISPSQRAGAIAVNPFNTYATPPVVNASTANFTDTNTPFEMYVDGIQHYSGFVVSYNQVFFPLPAALHSTIMLRTLWLHPASGTCTTASGGTVNGSITAILHMGSEMTFSDIDTTAGVSISFY